MTLYKIGRVCVKTVGRETGSYCVIVDEMEGRFVVVTGPKHVSSVRRRKCNIRHLEPLEMEIPIEKGADDSQRGHGNTCSGEAGSVAEAVNDEAEGRHDDTRASPAGEVVYPEYG